MEFLGSKFEMEIYLHFRLGMNFESLPCFSLSRGHFQSSISTTLLKKTPPNLTCGFNWSPSQIVIRGKYLQFEVENFNLKGSLHHGWLPPGWLCHMTRNLSWTRRTCGSVRIMWVMRSFSAPWHEIHGDGIGGACVFRRNSLSKLKST